jgi:hypothetical protein
MTFVPKYVPYREALRIVAERVGLKEGQINPLDLALTEGAIAAEVDRHSWGIWKPLPALQWTTARIYKGHGRPPMDLESKMSDYHFGLDQVRISMAEIDGLWRELAAYQKARTPHRPKGTGKQATDAALVERMRELITNRRANSKTDAARQILKEDNDSYGQSKDATVKRLVARYTENYGQ